MELNVNSPAYYKDHFGYDDVMSAFFQKTYLHFVDKEYSDTLRIIGITPIVVPNEMCNDDLWKESVRLVNDKQCAIISLRIDYEEYSNADSKKKIFLTKELILKGIKKIKSKINFDYESFERDFNVLF